MKDLTKKMVDKAQEGVNAASAFLADLPILGDYQDKERRREADRRLREGVARTLEASRQRIVEIERLLLNKGKLTALPYVDVAAVRLQTVIDRIRTAPSGYAGFFDMETLREAELEKLRQFDQGIAAAAPDIEAKIDLMQQTIEAGEDYSQRLVDLIQAIDDLGQRLDHRKEAIRALGEGADSLPAASTLND